MPKQDMRRVDMNSRVKTSFGRCLQLESGVSSAQLSSAQGCGYIGVAKLAMAGRL